MVTPQRSRLRRSRWKRAFTDSTAAMRPRSSMRPAICTVLPPGAAARSRISSPGCGSSSRTGTMLEGFCTYTRPSRAAPLSTRARRWSGGADHAPGGHSRGRGVIPSRRSSATASSSAAISVLTRKAADGGDRRERRQPSRRAAGSSRSTRERNSAGRPASGWHSLMTRGRGLYVPPLSGTRQPACVRPRGAGCRQGRRPLDRDPPTGPIRSRRRPANPAGLRPRRKPGRARPGAPPVSGSPVCSGRRGMTAATGRESKSCRSRVCHCGGGRRIP